MNENARDEPEKVIDEFGRDIRHPQPSSPLPETAWIHNDPITHEHVEQDADGEG